jgi:Fur family ferric uptake transcriptional regulator
MIMSRKRKEGDLLKGRPFTSQRRLILDLLYEAEGHVDAKEIYRRASARDQSISPATVYRSLRLFKDLGLVDERRLDSVRCQYEISGSRDHQHLVCRGCGNVTDFQSPVVRQLVDMVKRDLGFRVTKVELYVKGYCRRCGDKSR